METGKWFNPLPVALYLIISVVCVIVMGQVVFAAPVDEIILDENSKTLTIDGSMESSNESLFGKRVTLEILKQTSTKDQYILDHIAETTSDVQGRYSFEYKIEGAAGTYKVRLRNPLLTEPYDVVLAFDTLLSDIKAADNAVKMKEMIEKHEFELGNNESYNQMVRQNVDMTMVYSELVNSRNDFLSTTNIVNTLNRVVAVKVLEMASWEDIAVMIGSNSNNLGLDSISTYQTYTLTLNENQRKWVQKELETKTFNSVGDFYSKFSELVILKAIAEVGNWAQVYGILNNNINIFSDDFKSSMTKYKDQLNDTISKPKVQKALAGIPFESQQKLEEAFMKAVDEAYTGQIQSGSQITTGSGKKEGGSTNISADISTMVTPVPTIDTNMSFSDVEQTHWAWESILALYKEGVVAGQNGMFRPDDKITREEFIKILIAGLGLEDDTAVSSFEDVLTDAWYYKYVSSAYKLGVTNGMEDNSFGVGREITRQEMAALSYRALKIANVELKSVASDITFADSEDIEEYARQSIEAMQRAGIIKGVGDNRFAPKDYCTRAQASKIIYELSKAAHKIG